MGDEDRIAAEIQAHRKAVEQEYSLKQHEPRVLLEQAAAEAATTMIHLMQHSANDHLRFKAASYVLDRTTFQQQDEDKIASLVKRLSATSD